MNSIIDYFTKAFEDKNKSISPLAKEEQLFKQRIVTEDGRHSLRPFTREELLEKPTWEDLENWIKARETYVGRKILETCGGQAFERYRASHRDLEVLDTLEYCSGVDGQCSLFCCMYGRCNK